jgi:tRNA A-37 threonylcarbamoyl transferase component Bud32
MVRQARSRAAIHDGVPVSVPSPSSNSFIPGDIVDGKYCVEAVLGVGGMGVVLAARHLTLESEVAIKVLLPKFQKDPVVRERFLREARSAAVLKSSHVTKLFDIGIDRLDAPYIVMERLHGQDLEQLLTEHGPLDEKTAVDYLLQACEALAEAHAAGIVHRDLKPENLFLARTGNGTARLKVLDFGIAKASYETKMLTATADVMGTPHFMSPEQFKSTRDVTARTDVWALGAILYRSLANTLPFEGRDYVELCSNIMTQAAPPLEHRRPTVSAALAGIVRRCLEKDPMQRFANACELREALRSFAAQRKANDRLAMAATVPFDQPLAPVVLPKRRSHVPLFAVAAALAGVLTFGGMHRAKVMPYVHPASVQAEIPVTATAAPLEAAPTTIAIDAARTEKSVSESTKPVATKVAHRSKNRR